MNKRLLFRVKPLHRLLIGATILSALMPIPAGVRLAASQPAALQEFTPEEQARALLQSLTPEERVGQLFLVEFQGQATDAAAAIFDLIARHHVSGVILTRANDNFTSPPETAATARQLIQNLQDIKWIASQGVLTDTLTGEALEPAYIPLFVAISQDGDGYPADQILSGISQLPTPMAIGATWVPDLAEQVGFVNGQQLSALGFNLLLGPSLDVLESPRPELAGDPGVHTFGGDPFWVGQMGREYIQGVHIGSQGRMAVIAKHFPGAGGADRPLEEEVATVRKSLEQLKQIELAPFFSVTSEIPAAEGVTDGLLLSHIRYQGFFGNIRATTRPISFDESSLDEILSLEPFATWRQDGGLLVSDDLSSRAVRRFYDPANLSFNARLVVRDAFLAGNDLLYLGDILDAGDADSTTTILRILEFFTQKYNEDLTFAEQVDESVLRILTLKFRLYGEFTPAAILPPEVDLSAFEGAHPLTAAIARLGATLISPTSAELVSILPEAPDLDDRIVFISDEVLYQQCSTCPEMSALEIAAFSQTVLRLYGPEAGNQVQARNISSFSFADLQGMLDTLESGQELEADIRGANWIVFATLDQSLLRPASLALKRLLAERDDLLRDKQVIVFALNAPYYLDATEISKLTAFYALYGKSIEFIDTAARILFQEFSANTGALPVSVSGIGYDLISATSPDPGQIIPIMFDTVVEIVIVEGDETPPPAPIPVVELGEVLPIRTGVILDHNGHPVPDGTPVLFVYSLSGVETLSPPLVTVAGVVRDNYFVRNPGLLEISVVTEPLAQSSPLVIDIPIPEGFVTPLPVTEAPAATPSASETPEGVATEPSIVLEAEPEKTATDMIDWILALIMTLAICVVAYRIGLLIGQVIWSIRWTLLAAIGGLATYIYIAAKLPGSESILQADRGGMLWSTFFGALLGWSAGIIWRLMRGRARPRDPGASRQLPETGE